MTPFTSFPNLAPRTVAIAMLAGLLGACASTPPAEQAVAAPAAPAALAPAAGQRAAFVWHAIGSQIYECKAAENGAWAWVFVAPEADLYNQKDEKVGTHGAGPFWAAQDGSRTVGAVKARANGARPHDIPLLLLSAKSAGGTGKMARVSSVQRLNTEGGAAPTTGCVQAADAGKRVKEGYTSDYVFFEAR